MPGWEDAPEEAEPPAASWQNAPVEDDARPAGEAQNEAFPPAPKHDDGGLPAEAMRWLAENDKATPERRADVLRYSAASGLPPHLVDAGFDDVKQKVDANAVDWEAVAKRQPALSRFLRSRPEAIAILKTPEEVDRLHGIEWGLTGHWENAPRTPENIAKGFQLGEALEAAGVPAASALVPLIGKLMTAPSASMMTLAEAGTDMAVSARRALDVVGLGSPENNAAIQQLRLGMPQHDYAAAVGHDNSWQDVSPQRILARGFLAPFRLAPMVGATMTATAAGAAAAPIVGLSAGVGTFVGGAAVNTALNLGTAKEVITRGEERDLTGGERALAIAASGIGGVVMQAGVGAVVGKLAGAFGKKAATDAATAAVKEALTDSVNPALDAVERTLFHYGKDVAMGSAAMAAQSTLNLTARQAAEGQFDGKELAVGFKDAFLGSLADMALMAALPTGRQLLQDVQLNSRMAQDGYRYQQMVEGAKASDLLEKSPELFRQAVEHAGDKAVYIPAEDFATYFQGKKVDPEKMAGDLLKDDGKAYREAVATGGDIRIPASEFLTKLGKTEHAEGLAADVKLSPEVPTAKQAMRDQARLEERLTGEAKRRAPELKEGKAQVETFIREQATQAGFGGEESAAVAKQVAEYAGAMALRLNISVAEAARLGGLQHLSILGPKGEQVATAARAAFASYVQAPQASQLLRERQATMSPEARAREVYIDSNTGLLNEKAFNELGKANDKPLVGHISVEGVKYLNDSVSHDHADLLYRSVAKALHDIDPTAAKVGGDFAVRVKDQAELDDIITRLHDSMAVKGFGITGATGTTFKAAGEAHGEKKAALEKAGARSERGQRPSGLTAEPGDLVFPEDRASAEVPETLRQRVGGLSEEDYFKEAYTHEKTGLLTSEGWNAIPRKAAVASIDLKGLKKINGTFGEEAGDELLRFFGELSAQHGGSSFDFAHLHGDEYAAQHNDPAALAAFLEKLAPVVQDVRVVKHHTDGRTTEVQLGFRHGIGESYESADADLNARKKLEPGTTPEPVGATKGTSGDLARVQEALGKRRKDFGRGAARQGFPGSGEAQLGQPLAHVEGEPVTLDQRGAIRFEWGKHGEMSRADIPKLLGGDESTLAHESAHFLSWSLHNIATSDLATPEIKADYAALLKYGGFESPEQRVAEARAKTKEGIAKEEKFSHAWEQYLMEGKAPSKALRPVFSRFRLWMTHIYKGMAGIEATYESKFGQPLEMTDEVRGVFDRMLAGDAALAKANETKGDAVEQTAFARMSPAEREEYRKTAEEARISAEEETAQRAKEIYEQRVGPEREKVRAQVSAQLDANPVYKATRFLQEGGEDLPDFLKDADGNPKKLSRSDFVSKFGTDAARAMPAGVFSAKKKGGLKIEEAATLFGFDSAEAMKKAFADTEPRERALAKGTQATMDALYGPAMKHLEDAAVDASHSEPAIRGELKLLRSLAKEVNPAAERRVSAMSLPKLKQVASQLLDEAMVSDIDPAKYQRQERQAALKAAELWGAGKKDEAVAQRESRLLNMLLYREARDRADALEKGRAKLERYTSDEARGKLGKADPIYRDVHDQLLEAVGVAQPSGEKGRPTLDDFLARAQQDAHAIGFDVPAIKELLDGPTDWGNLKYLEAQNVLDAVENIRRAARFTTDLTTLGKQEDRAALFDELARTAKPILGAQPFTQRAKTLGEKIGHLARGADAMLADTESLANDLDSGNRNGPAHRLLVDARLACRDKAVELEKAVGDVIREKFEKMPKALRGRLNDRVEGLSDILQVGPQYQGRVRAPETRDVLYSLFLYQGHEGGRQRIRDGNGWTDAQVGKAISLLEKPELEFLQGVLDASNKLLPDLQRVHEQRTGLPLELVKAMPIEVNGVVYPGGYSPIKYDSRVAKQGTLQEADVVASLFGSSYQRPAVYSGHTKGRLEKVNAPVSLEWGTIPSHFSQAIHDIAYGDWVREAGSVLLDPRFKAIAEQSIGPERAAELVPWLRDVANDRADSAAGHVSGFMTEAGRFTRGRVAVAVIGANIPSMIAHLTDPMVAMAEGVPLRYIGAAYPKVIDPTRWNEHPEFADSQEIAYRDSHGALREQFAQVSGKQGPVGRIVSEVSFGLREHLDHFQSRVIFKAAYDHALSQGMTHEEAVTRGDDVLRAVLPSGDIAEKAPILRTKNGMAAVLMFYGYANKMYNAWLRNPIRNTQRTWMDPESTGGDRFKAVGGLAAKMLAMGAIAAGGAFIAGRGWKKEEEDPAGVAWWATRRALLEPLNTVPFLGSVAEKLVEGKVVSTRTEPTIQFVDDLANRVEKAAKKSMNGDSSDDNEVLKAVEALASAAGPIGQAHRTFDYMNQVYTGQESPRGPLDVASGLIYGKHKDQGANPLSVAQDKLSGE